MNTIYKSLVILLVSMCSAKTITAQFNMTADLRARTEYRHGYKEPFPVNADAALFTIQRSRLNLLHSSPVADIKLSVQDVRVWGDVNTLNTKDKNAPSLHEGWVNIKVDSFFSVKVGRQEINLDNQRFFGAVDWTMQARSHDAVVAVYSKNKFTAVGLLGYNQSSDFNSGNIYELNNFKSAQAIWLHKDWKNISGSFLFLNAGLQQIDATNTQNTATRISQSIGTIWNYNSSKISGFVNAYIQTGKDAKNNDWSANYWGGELNYKTSKKLTIGLGYEQMSGNEGGKINNGKNKAFNPLFGTNRKFNGWLDYYYVGNHINSVGLKDLYLKAVAKIGNKNSLVAMYHVFGAEKGVAGTSSKDLGSEIDLHYTYKVNSVLDLNVGYSKYFGTDAFRLLKSTNSKESNHWAWVMVQYKPTLFSEK